MSRRTSASKTLDRRSFLEAGLAASAATLAARGTLQGPQPASPAFPLEEATLDELRIG